MRTTSDSRNVAGTLTKIAVFSCVSRSNEAWPEIARPNDPIALGMILVLALGARPVVHSSSVRERKYAALNSNGWPTTSTTQDGLPTPMKSWLLAYESQVSTLHEPAAETSDVSTT